MKKFYLPLFIVLQFSFRLQIFAQGSAGESAKYEYRSLVDMQTAGILEKGFVGITSDIMPQGVLIEKLEVGVFDNVSFGISYGGSNIIGTGEPNWYKVPAINLRFRLFNETILMPAITVGFDSQGKGIYSDSLKRYAIKSPGFFAATSKNFAMLGYLSIHGSVNYSLETKDGDNFMDLHLGIEKTLGSNFSFIGEYDFALNDNNNQAFGSGNGYLNMGIRWSAGSGLTFGFDLRDLLNNKKLNPSTADRAFKIEYIKNIFK